MTLLLFCLGAKAFLQIPAPYNNFGWFIDNNNAYTGFYPGGVPPPFLWPLLFLPTPTLIHALTTRTPFRITSIRQSTGPSFRTQCRQDSRDFRKATA
jgi:hypothetical protein